VTGSLDLSTDAGVTMARVMLAVAHKSSRDTSRRVRRKQEQLAAEGRTSGGGVRPYGYRHDKNAPGGLAVVEAEAAVIREVVGRLLQGESLSGVARNLEAIGVSTVTGAPWSARSVGAVVEKPTVAGLRTHRGSVVGRAKWEPVVDVETWELLRTELRRRGKNGKSNVLTRWLTGAMTCGLCGHEMLAWSGASAHRYWCATPRGGCGKVAIHGPHAEEWVTDLAVGYLSRADVLADLHAGISADGTRTARDELDADQRQLVELADLWARKVVTLDEYLSARGTIADRIERATATLSVSTPAVVSGLLNAVDVAGAFDALPPVGKRDAVQHVLGPITVQPLASSAPRRFDGDRIVVERWRA
jgi:hypothetical protein